MCYFELDRMKTDVSLSFKIAISKILVIKYIKIQGKKRCKSVPSSIFSNNFFYLPFLINH